MRQDLRQGGVGDCWFMSARFSAISAWSNQVAPSMVKTVKCEALAVVAERPDLVLRLFGGETARTAEHGQRRIPKKDSDSNLELPSRMSCGRLLLYLLFMW